jgi:hypothetical protein
MAFGREIDMGLDMHFGASHSAWVALCVFWNWDEGVD